MYPRKFARDIAKVLCKLVYPRERPVEPVMFASDATALVNEPALKRRRLITQAIPKVSRSSEMTNQMQSKRRKLNGKQSSLSALEAWTQVFDMIDMKLARVGKLLVHDENILQELQELLPDKKIKFAIACRGSTRTIAPSEDVAQHSLA
jgi:recombinational DNA repair ATPase RecF